MAQGLRSWERAWLDWAYPIVRISVEAPDHLQWCRSQLGPAEYPHDETCDPASDPTLRWPGYVGSDWRPQGGVLFVGSVHSDFTKDGPRKGAPERVAIVATLAAANRQWRDHVRTPTGDLRYLAATREAYAALIPGWTRDGAFAKVRDELRDNIDAIAWTNLAHCRARPQSINEYPLQRKWSGKRGLFPIAELVTALHPAAVLASVAPIETSHRDRYSFTPTDGTPPLLFAFNGLTKARTGLAPSVWAPAAAVEIRKRRQESDSGVAGSGPD